MGKAVKRVLAVLLTIILLVVVVVGCYIAYLMITYNRYEPRESLDFMEYKKRFGSFQGLLAATGNFHSLTRLTSYQNPYPDGEIGVLRKGSYADLVILKGNPVEDLDLLGNTENILLVMKDGQVYKNTLE